jgi:transposase
MDKSPALIRQPYTSDLTDSQWALLEPLLPVHTSGRPRTTNMREVCNAIFYLLTNGCVPDGGYAGKLIEYVYYWFWLVLEIVKRSDDQKGFKILPRRWVVERTLGWLTNYRRLSRNYECWTETSEAMVKMAMIHIMLHSSPILITLPRLVSKLNGKKTKWHRKMRGAHWNLPLRTHQTGSLQKRHRTVRNGVESGVTKWNHPLSQICYMP